MAPSVDTVRHRRRVRPVPAALRSMVVPGWGQIAVDRRRLGWSLVAASLLALAVVALLWWVLGIAWLAAGLADPDVLLGALVANGLVAVGRMAVTGDAWFRAGGRSIAVAIVLGAAVLTPHVLVGYLGMETRSTMLTVFASESSETTRPAPTTNATIAPPTTAAPVATTEAAPVTIALPDPTVVEPELPTPPPRVDDPIGDRYNVLLLGGDAGPYRSGLRTDAIVLVSVDLVSGDAALFGIPRNWTGLRLGDGTPIPNRIMNEVYEWGRSHPEHFGSFDPGVSAVVDVVEVVTRVDIDHAVLVDITGFASVVDALGGLTIDVPRSVYGPRYNPSTGLYEMIWIRRGEQELDGAAALAYIRERYQSSDYDRMDRQRCVLAALVEGADAASVLLGLGDLLASIEAHVTTDIPIDHVPGLIRLSDRVVADEIRAIRFDQTWAGGWNAEGYAIPDIERVSAAIHQTILDPEASVGTVAETISGSCG